MKVHWFYKEVGKGGESPISSLDVYCVSLGWENWNVVMCGWVQHEKFDICMIVGTT